MKPIEHLVVVRVQDLLLGFDVADVREVLNDEEVLPVPLTASMVRGLVNLRGEVVTVIDARTLLQMGALPSDQRRCNLVVHHRRSLLSLEVDEVLEVARVDSLLVVPRPEGMHEAVRRLTAGVYHRERDLVLMVDVAQLFEVIANGGKLEERQETPCGRS